ncbi:PAS domain-containing sensor histidine kinase [Maribacter halichondriae]|uniref:PAS domain-containing sensor histidine kinase n=1 Tax=Maribacter halichondriae TaxID=2980554 RepID=UPI00307618E1
MRVFEKNSNIFKLLSEAVSEGIVVVNQEQMIVAANNRANAMLGYDEDELVGMSLNSLIPKSLRKSHKKHVQDYYKQEKQHRKARGRNLLGLSKNGEEIPIEVGLNPFSLYGNTYVLALILDLTESKQKEKEIYELNADLDRKIKERTGELRDTVAELKREIKRRKKAEERIKSALQKERELNELKTKFLSLVSHEFKTPLSGILTSATLVGKYAEAEQQEKRDKHLKTIIGEVRHLNAILNDFLSIEKLEKGKELYTLADFSLSKVVNEVVYNANMMLKIGQKINYPSNIDDVTLCQDEKIVTIALTNLLYNAIKYSSEDTEIDLVVKLLKDKVVFQVVDQGIGIPKKDQKHIFERYYRAENVLLTQGTGIGLNIVKGHLENLGEASLLLAKKTREALLRSSFLLKSDFLSR